MFASIGYYICIPFAWLVRLFYNLADNYGLALILFTLVIKLIMLPFQIKSKKSMVRMSRMSGKMQEIQKKYANNQAKMNEEVQRLYMEEGVNPMSGCLWSFLPLPILMALYSIIRQPITHFMMLGQDVLTKLVNAVADAGLSLEKIVMMKDGVMQMKDGIPVMQPYGQIELAHVIAQNQDLSQIAQGYDGWMNVNYNFLGLNLSRTPSSTFAEFAFTWAIIGLILIPILSGVSQMIMSKVAMSNTPQTGAGAGSTKMMMYMMPLFSVYIAFIMPAALGVYWIAQSVFSIVQEVIMNKFFNQKIEAEENAKYEAKQADRHRRMEEAKKLQEKQKQEAAKKLTLKEKQELAHEAKLAKAAKKGTSTTEAGRVDDRPYARGRAYQADRYNNEG